MPYTDDEIARLVAEGDAQENEDGSITWAVDNSQDKKPGTWLVRPPQAAPLITPENGADMAMRRQEKRRMALESGFAIGITKALQEKFGDDFSQVLTTDEALQAFVSLVAQAATDTDRKDFSRLANMLLTALEAVPQKQIRVDQRKQTIDMSGSQIALLQESPAIRRLLDNDG